MKKILLVLVVLFIANIGCKKVSMNGGNTCACSPVQGPAMLLVIQDANGQDLLDPQTNGALAKDKIDVYRKDAAGKIIPLYFEIRPQFSYGEQKFKYYQLSLPELGFVQRGTPGTAYLKLGSAEPREVTIELSQTSNQVVKVTIDKKEAQRDADTIANYASVFYLKI
ncbi:hypothetical protein [Mucilaginibacter sp.]|uniref:hypothetical protein n=1 Tax=Mucilaginibacter sp. TaxID=1882438 RepID=UPI0035BC8ABF